MDASLRLALETALGSRITRARALSGGCTSAAWRVETAAGATLFAKTHAKARMFPAEARGLRWLGEVGALAVPRVIAVSGAGDPVGFIVLEYIEPGRPRASTWEALGHGLARLHRAGPGRFGLDHDNFIGDIPQQNGWMDDWGAFYRDRRLVPLIRRAAALLTPDLHHDLDRLLDTLPERVGPPEPPARLHGDLWFGNLHVDHQGTPWLIDPACYAGHRELDLAFMRLFGGYDPRCFAAYEESWPLAPGARQREALYQVDYLLVHVAMVGAGYVGQLAEVVARALR